MIRLILSTAALLATTPAAAQTVEQAQTAIAMDLAELPGVTVKQWVDTVKKTGLSVRSVTASKALTGCRTEFATPEVKLQANLQTGPSLVVDWSMIAEIRRDGDVALELVSKKQDVRTAIEFPNSAAADDFSGAFEFLRRNCG